MTARGPDPEATTEKLLVAIRNHYAPAVGTSEIAERVGVARQTVDRRLRKLESEGLVETEKVGQARIWWLTTEGRRRIDDKN